MYERLHEVSWRLERLGLTHNSSYVSMLRRIVGPGDFAALRVLADVCGTTIANLAESEDDDLATLQNEYQTTSAKLAGAPEMASEYSDSGGVAL